MKKVLFATTALIATAGVAVAESDLSFGGYGRFGLIYDESKTGTDKETRLEQRFRLTITGKTESDAGVKFEGRIRLETNENDEGGAGGTGPGAAGFAVTAGGFRLDVGHVSDVLDSGDVVKLNGIGVGLTGFIETNDAATGFDKNGFGADEVKRQKVKARYKVGDFTVAASFAQGNQSLGADSYVQFGLGYEFGNVQVGAVYGARNNDEDEDYWAANVRGSAGALKYHAVVGDSDQQDELFYGLSFSYDISSATQIQAVFADGGEDTATTSDTVFGIGFKHNLGGGVSLRGGIGQEDDGLTRADLGVRFDF